MLRKLSAIIILLCVTASMALAQTRKITGEVLDAKDGSPLMGATITIKNHPNVNAITDANGQFSINVPQGVKTLTVEYIGMESKEHPIKGDKMRIYLEENVSMMQEVVVTGYGSAKKLGSVTGSLGVVKSEKLANIPTANFTDALQGQVSGLSVLSSSGEPTAAATIRLRGINTLNAGTAPLFVLDGTPIPADVFNALNPSDIANITVLKDAASTSIYGARAANGVIVITSKKGKMEQRPTVKISAQYGMSNIINSGTKMMSSTQYLDFREKLEPGLMNNAEWNFHRKVVEKNGISTDWVKEIYRNNAPTLQLNASVMGGSSNTNYYVSINHLNRQGIEPLSGVSRESIRFNEDIRITPMLKVGVDINLAYANSQTNPEQNAGGGIYVTNPTVFTRLARPDDAPYYYTTNSDGSINRSSATDPRVGQRADYLHYSGTNFYNPNWMAEHRERESHTVHLNGTIFEELTPIKGLHLKAVQALAAYDDMFTSISKPRDAYVSPMGDVVDPYGDGTVPYRREDALRWYQFTSSNTAEYIFNIGKHDITVLAGHETIYSKDYGFAVSREGLSDVRMLLLTNATEEPAVSQGTTETVYNSFFGKASYSYGDKYNFEASIRRDGSSRFSRSKLWGTFWAIGGRWNMMSEKFMQPAKSWLNQLDLKASHGTSGNSDIGDYQYRGFASSANVQYEGSTGLILIQPSVAEYSWETTAQTNIGIETRLFNRFSLSVDFYIKKTTDLLMDIPYSYTTGYSEGIGNIASISNKGIDLNLDIDILHTKDIYWTFTSRFGYNKDKVTSLFNGIDELVRTGTGQKYQVGKSSGDFYIVKRAGIDPRDGSQMWYDLDGNLTKVYTESNSQYTGKNRYAPFYGGFGSSFSWKGLSVNCDISWVLGKYSMNNDRYFYENAQYGMTYNQSVSMENIWTTPGQITDIPAATETIMMDDHLLENASFLRLKNLTVAYALPANWYKALNFVSAVRLSATARNLFTITNYTGYDPEPDKNVIQFNYPNTRDFTFGIEVTF